MKTRNLLGSIALLLSPAALAAEYDYSIEVLNLTGGTYFTPLLVAAHPASTGLFTPGMPASANLRSMAEGGAIAPLAMDLMNAGAKTLENPAAGLLAPGASTRAVLQNLDAANNRLSIVAMLLPSNDGFVALNAMPLPTQKGTYTYWLNAYDAGTEANNEIRGSGAPGQPGMPVPPPLESKVGTGGTGVVGAQAEGFVHIHRGVLGDLDMSAGTSDINAAQQRWLNPIARVTVTVE
jgi:hypothetical protein